MSRPATNAQSQPAAFPATHWSVIVEARSSAAPELSWLCSHYRNPLLIYLRRLGLNETDAEDRVQGFFTSLLQHDFLRNVSPDKGRFRTFLISALKNYLHDHTDRATAKKRGGGLEPLSLDALAESGQSVPEPRYGGTTPDMAYDRAWGDTVVTNALRLLEAECLVANHKDLYDALEPMLYQDQDTGGYRQVGERLGMAEGAVRTAAKRLRERLRQLIRNQVKQTVAREADVESELRYLIELAARPPS